MDAFSTQSQKQILIAGLLYQMVKHSKPWRHYTDWTVRQSWDMRKLVRKLRNLNCALPDFFCLRNLRLCFSYIFLVAQFAFALSRFFFSIAEFAFAHRLFKI